ncbi:hypothetical protein BC832DRAFT_177304 [Gaertneriomyces semiglobifer]|nr:hypothetical protein BC832DRAFT_177304 [Gaertneriomyces semiglobifer]
MGWFSLHTNLMRLDHLCAHCPHPIPHPQLFFFFLFLLPSFLLNLPPHIHTRNPDPIQPTRHDTIGAARPRCPQHTNLWRHTHTHTRTWQPTAQSIKRCHLDVSPPCWLGFSS